MTEAACPETAEGSLTYHGGNLAAARRRFPGAPEPWIDLSTGINACSYPAAPLSAGALASLPEPAALAGLEAAAAEAYGAADAGLVVAAPGTQALVQWLPQIKPARRVGILGFTYAEHERSWRRGGADVRIVERLAELSDVDVAVVVNPNNPDGRLVPAGDLAHLAAELARRGGTLVVDEAFIDVVRPGGSLVPTLPASGCVVLRSIGKTFGLAGLRLGFAVASADIAPALRQALGPWPVSGPAIDIGGQALRDRRWLAAEVGRLHRDAARLDAMLAGAGFDVAGGTALYRLATHAAAGDWFDRLGGAGILVRPFAERETWLRFGIPGGRSAWDRLEGVLSRATPTRTAR